LIQIALYYFVIFLDYLRKLILVVEATKLLHGVLVLPALAALQEFGRSALVVLPILTQLRGGDTALRVRVIAGTLDQDFLVVIHRNLLVNLAKAEFSSFDLLDTRNVWVDLVVLALNGGARVQPLL
jgi:hypothetical protein